ncbi:MAG: hypothetical protein P9L94_13495 [Candidatus Hinthialibacter antarcticus]|nr:hypothetical protein [Candidatus Hinthialibacter antarcticus]
MDDSLCGSIVELSFSQFLLKKSMRQADAASRILLDFLSVYMKGLRGSIFVSPSLDLHLQIE